MAVITITIPDAVLPRVIDGMASMHGWTAADGPKAAFAKKALIRYVVANVRAAERQAEEAAAPPSKVTELEGLT